MKTNLILIIIFVISLILISGCSSQKQRDFPQRGDFPGMGDMTEEERQERFEQRNREERPEIFEEMQQKMAEACKGKTEGEPCLLENPRGEIEGVCKDIDSNLVCTFDRPMRER